MPRREDKYIADSLLFDHRQFDGQRRNVEWLQTAYNAYCRLQGFRDTRSECKDYAYGKQYNNQIVVNGRRMTKEQYLKEKGIPVIQTNILGKVKRVTQGQFRLNATKPTCSTPDPSEKEYGDVLSELLRKNMKLNRRDELDARQFEEFLISGLAIYKVSWAFRRGKLDVWTDPVNPNFIFFPHSLDYSLEDIRFCGLLHDMDFSDVLAKWSHSDADDVRLRDIYHHCQDQDYLAAQFSTDRRSFDIRNTDFYTPAEFGKCRVIELWTKERRKAWLCTDPLEPEPYYVPYAQRKMIEALNAERLAANIKRWPDGSPMTDELGQVQYFIDPKVYAEQNVISFERCIETFWYFRYLSPDGYVLEEGESPYWNGAESFHPFIFKPYPFIDGEIHSFISECQPSQDYFNYYMIALDYYMRNASKGTLVIDDQALSDEQSPEDVLQAWNSTNSAVFWSSKRGGKEPHAAQAGTMPSGYDYIIQLSRSLMEDVSGVQAAMQGKQAGTSGVLYQAQIAQASTSILDLLRTYNAFLEETAYKVLKVMQCKYSGQKAVSIAGQTIPYNMETMHDVDIDVTIAEGSDSPLYRALNNQFLLSMVEKGQIPMRVALESGDFYNSSQILARLDQYERQMQQQQQQLPPLSAASAKGPALQAPQQGPTQGVQQPQVQTQI
jgi:hypothetical protein